MALQKKTIRLLILEDSQNEAERLVSLFRNAGQATRVHRLTSSDDLASALQQTWDLLIAAPSSENLEPSEAIAAIRRQAKDIPIVQLTASNDAEAITDALTLGAQDALPQGEDEWLLLVANRELANLEQRRARRSAEVALREAEKRCQLLLDSSVDAIAYVHDGMHIYANRAYLELFGYADVEDLEGMPMIDLIEACDQGSFKTFLKNYQTMEGNSELTCSGVRVDGDSFKARMHFSPATYDGEPCIQVVIRAENDSAELQKLREISTQDPITGLHNRNHFTELVDSAVERAVNAGQIASAPIAVPTNSPTATRSSAMTRLTNWRRRQVAAISPPCCSRRWTPTVSACCSSRSSACAATATSTTRCCCACSTHRASKSRQPSSSAPPATPAWPARSTAG